ncbi:uncharacterized protein CLUP02_17759 [Colletotrichum lupini]|uniref:Uncharacterized protein n=1 Tax=Colletotrichum lupini TaxID=145971 RepID=A0A9Q8SF51_9PEZI|nr:uncharacterized protein CLUP02_17759 [Colletotrichum lupini]UQC76246.1 hypothetical protein CLUP02_17759 [Colletotrichum lupini]
MPVTSTTCRVSYGEMFFMIYDHLVRSWNLVSLSVCRNNSTTLDSCKGRKGRSGRGALAGWSKTGGVEEGDVNVWHGASAALAAFGSPPSPLWDWSYGTSLSAARPWWRMTLLKLEGLTREGEAHASLISERGSFGSAEISGCFTQSGVSHRRTPKITQNLESTSQTRFWWIVDRSSHMETLSNKLRSGYGAVPGACGMPKVDATQIQRGTRMQV